MVKIRYTLVLPPCLPPVEVARLLGTLQRKALDLPFQSVSDIYIVDSPKQGPHLVFPGLKPLQAIGFNCNVNEGKEGRLTMWFYQYPKYNGVAVPWCHWGECCIVPDDQFYTTRHVAVISLMDLAKKLGVSLEVIDIGGYWESRNRSALDRMRKWLAAVPI